MPTKTISICMYIYMMHIFKDGASGVQVEDIKQLIV